GWGPHRSLQDGLNNPLESRVPQSLNPFGTGSKAGWVSVRTHRDIVGEVKTVTGLQTGGWWFVSIAVEQEINEAALKAGPTVGIDLAVVNAIATSGGEMFDLPRVSAQE
ncbi:hypothetical protein C8P69_1061, partial [Phreatobacter oligotrophus]